MSMENNEPIEEPERRLGRLPAKVSRKALMFSDFFKFLTLPKTQTYWRNKKPLPLRSFGNLRMGCCTRAKQAVAAMRMERLEQRRTIDITDDEVIRVYRSMSDRLYGGGDNGAYEDDALNEWRNPDLTFKDTEGHPLTIDAYLRINHMNHDELKAALALSGAKGIAVCLNLPSAFRTMNPPHHWDVPANAPMIGKWMPGSWGGHSMWSNGYDRDGFILDHTWELPNQVVTYTAAFAYLDEAHLVIDSVNTWRKAADKTTTEGRKIRKALGDVVDAVNEISSIQIEA